jgi:hypothetical protein
MSAGKLRSVGLLEGNINIDIKEVGCKDARLQEPSSSTTESFRVIINVLWETGLTFSQTIRRVSTEAIQACQDTDELRVTKTMTDTNYLHYLASLAHAC